LLLAASTTWSATCSVSADGVNFGNYDPLSSQSLDSTGNISVICDAATAYSLSLSPGRGSYSARAMSNGLHELFYNLYTDATHTTLWGDGSDSTAVVGTTGINDRHTVYGRIPSRQNAFTGNYADTLVITLTF
jgi:spore coat protein U-like protein